MKNELIKYIKIILLTILVSFSLLTADPVPQLPKIITFAGMNVPLDKFDVRNRIEKVLNNLIYDRKNYMQSIIDNQNIYFPEVKTILEKYNLATDFAYIIPVESNFNMRALSQSKASGLWQLMPATARMYGLRVDEQIDERNLLRKSTKVAAEHLTHLMNIFENNVFLVLAAFNNGEGNIASMLESQNSKDFWDCISNSETDLYVPKIIAYKIILSDPEKYGFRSTSAVKFPIYEPCTISLASKNLPYREICRILNITFREFYSANPHLKYKSYKSESYISKFTALEIFIPQGLKINLLTKLKNNGYLQSDNIVLLDTSSEQSIVENIDNIGFCNRKIKNCRHHKQFYKDCNTDLQRISPNIF